MKSLCFLVLASLLPLNANAYSFCGCKSFPTNITWEQKLDLAKKWQKSLPTFFTYQILYSEKEDEFRPKPKCSIDNEELRKSIALKGLYGFRSKSLKQTFYNLKPKLGSTTGIAGKTDGAVASAGKKSTLDIKYKSKLWTGTSVFKNRKSPITIPSCYEENPNNDNIFLVETEKGNLVKAVAYTKLKTDEKTHYKKSCRSPCPK